jgi:hypothetical protein
MFWTWFIVNFIFAIAFQGVVVLMNLAVRYLPYLFSGMAGGSRHTPTLDRTTSMIGDASFILFTASGVAIIAFPILIYFFNDWILVNGRQAFLLPWILPLLASFMMGLSWSREGITVFSVIIFCLLFVPALISFLAYGWIFLPRYFN